MSKKLLMDKLELLTTYVFSEDKPRSEWIDLSYYKDCDILILDYDISFSSEEWFTYLVNNNQTTLYYVSAKSDKLNSFIHMIRLNGKSTHKFIKFQPEQMITSIQFGVYYPNQAKVLEGSTVKIYGGKFNI